MNKIQLREQINPSIRKSVKYLYVFDDYNGCNILFVTNDDNVLAVQRLNRLQNKLELLFVNAKTGVSNVVYTDESKTYVDVTDDLRFVGNKGFIITSEKNEYNHLYYYDLTGKLILQVTNGGWDVNFGDKNYSFSILY